MVRLRQAPDALLRLAHDQEPGQATIDLAAGEAVRMRVIEVGAGGVAHGEVVDIFAAGADGEARMAVGRLGHDHAVPVDDGRLGEAIAENDAHPLTAPELKRGAEVGRGRPEGIAATAQHLAGVAQHRRVTPAPDTGAAGGGGEAQDELGRLGGHRRAQRPRRGGEARAQCLQHVSSCPHLESPCPQGLPVARRRSTIGISRSLTNSGVIGPMCL